MPVFWYIAIILAFLYLIWIGLFFFGWLRTPSFSVRKEPGNTSLSVIVPVRNEENTICRLLGVLAEQEYPRDLFEIIVVDDHSSDRTPFIIADFSKRYGNIRFLSLSEGEEGKKAALRKGILLSGNQLILTVDADCIPSPLWVKTMAGCFERTGAKLIAGSVLMKGEKGFFSKFQELEFLSLLGSAAGAIYIGKPVMCNGANLGFKKEAWLEVYDPASEKITSGDDVFLLLAISKSGKRSTVFLKAPEAVVITEAQSRPAQFLRQRRRWASKSIHYKGWAPIFTAILVFSINFYTLICLFAAIFNTWFLLIAAFLYILKSVADYPFLYSVSGFFNKRELMRYFPAIQFIYFFYISFTAISAFAGTPEWKGRDVRI